MRRDIASTAQAASRASVLGSHLEQSAATTVEHLERRDDTSAVLAGISAGPLLVGSDGRSLLRVDPEHDTLACLPASCIREAKVESRQARSDSVGRTTSTSVTTGTSRTSGGGWQATSGRVSGDIGESGSGVGASFSGKQSQSGSFGYNESTSSESKTRTQGSTTTRTQQTYLHQLDVFTRVPEMPALTLDFGENESLPRQLYGVVAAAIEPGATPPVPASRSKDVAPSLDRLDRLRQQGVLTEDEFRQQKARLLA